MSTFRVRVKENLGIKSVNRFGKPGTEWLVLDGMICDYTGYQWGCEIESLSDLNWWFMDSDDYKTVFELVESATKDQSNTSDNVNHPKHYTTGKYECIDVIEDWGLGYHLGNTIKYICRHDKKGTPLEDIDKAIWYLKRYRESLTQETETSNSQGDRCRESIAECGENE